MDCKSILVVEDDQAIREIVQEILELEGFKVATAENGKEALRFIHKHDGPCLILLDLMMPVMNGWEFMEAIRSQHAHVLATIPIVIVSAVADEAEILKEYQCRTVKKPVDIHQLLSLARQYCDPS